MKKKFAVFSMFTLIGVFSTSSALAQGQAGTTLNASVTADPNWTQTYDHDWTLEKTSDTASLILPEDESATVTYTLSITKSNPEPTESKVVIGEICVTNGGERDTTDLNVDAQLQAKNGGGPFSDVVGAADLNINGAAELEAGESNCWDYLIAYDFQPGQTYKILGLVTITNHSGKLGEASGPNPKADFTYPDSPEEIHLDDEAELVDVLTCPTGFTCEPDSEIWNGGVWTLNQNQTITIPVTIFNDQAPCGNNFTVLNDANLTENDSLFNHEVGTVEIGVYTDDCPEIALGCTYTQGYWKNHLSAWPIESMPLGTIHSYNVSQLLSIFKQPVKGNGLVNLAHQLIAAKLNVANGADDTAVATVIISADTLIGGLLVPPVGGGILPTKATSAMNGVLASFNEGEIGPGHCSD